MMVQPGIMALLLGSGLTVSMLGYAAYQGVQILRYWDITSGSERQLALERRTYLVSTLMSYAMGFQVLSLFLFIYTADTLSPLFVGAMCAAGSLKVNGFGYPALLLNIVGCLLAGLWLIVNNTDNKAYNYPLIRIKYWFLLFIAPFFFAETILQGEYFLRLQPNIITSCCGVLFSIDAGNVVADLLSLPRTMAETVFFVSVPITLALGYSVYLRNKGAVLFSVAAFAQFLISLIALIVFISIYFYELPTHHCPFCLLHQEYGFVGYFLYGTILVSTISGMGTGLIQPFSTIASLCEVIPPVQKRLALISIVSLGMFILATGYGMLFSNLSMQAY